MKTYMKGMNAEGTFSPGNATGRTRVYHSITLSKGQPQGTKLDAEGSFTLPGKSLQLPLLFGTRTLFNRITGLYDGSRSCPERVLIAGENDLFLTSVFYTSNKTSETAPLANIADFLSDNLPKVRLVVFNDESSQDQEDRLAAAKPLAVAVEKLVNGWRSESRLTTPRRLETGKIRIANALMTVDIEVESVESFLSQDDLPPETLLDFVPEGATPPAFSSTPATFRSNCIAWHNKIRDGGLTAPADLAYLVTRHVRRLQLDNEQLVRCLVVGPLTEAALGPLAARIETRPDLALKRDNVTTFAEVYRNEVPDPVIVDPAVDRQNAAERKRAVVNFYEIFVNRVRRAETLSDIADDIEAQLVAAFAPKIVFSDSTRMGALSEMVPASAGAFDVLKALSDAGFEKWGCFLEQQGEAPDLFYGADMVFLGFEQKAGEGKLLAEKAVMFIPEFDAANRIARLEARDQRVTQALDLHPGCKARL